ncbi:sugar transferase [candidate division MSBL1 archaeon SCGC-AAA385M11]|nr:sugar transferase [candidate division MSBL1 archaeon SCGC-AAA385M11]
MSLTPEQAFLKRGFDLALSSLGLLAICWIIIPAYILASLDTKASGFFIQKRIGREGKPFPLIKLRTMRKEKNPSTYVTTSHDPRITRLGRFWRRTKIDELPQLINVFLGQMSFVGPRPDMPGYADRLQGKDRVILTLRPGITGPATLKYRDEEALLARAEDPQAYNDEVIWPDKLRLNREYVESWSFGKDLRYIWRTMARKSEDRGP